jgi:hypothetical protein
MGLDMYLMSELYLSQYTEGHADIINHIKQHELMKDVNLPIKYIRCEAIYWRKANQIHNWFVNNVQDGNDDCKEYYVSGDDLRELRSLVERVLEDHSLAKELLPSSSGFFFGSTDYDEVYFSDLEFTKSRLDELLTEKYGRWDFKYSSSW